MTETLRTTDSPRKIQILVVEDEKIIALNLKESLESLGEDHTLLTEFAIKLPIVQS